MKDSFIQESSDTVITFCGIEKRIKCKISLTDLIKYKDSYLYLLWEQEQNPQKDDYNTNYPEIYLPLVISHMCGRPLFLELKSRTELELIKQHFQFYNIPYPLEIDDLLEKDWNDGLKGVYGYLTMIANQLIRLNQSNVELQSVFSSLCKTVETIHVDIQDLKKVINEKNISDSSLNISSTPSLKPLPSASPSPTNRSTDPVNTKTMQAELKLAQEQIETMQKDRLSIENIVYICRRENISLQQRINRYISTQGDIYNPNMLFVDSKIIGGIYIYRDEIVEWLGRDTQWKLLYRGSKDGFKASTFHRKCDNSCKTLTIIRHINQNGFTNIFGGYTKQSWKGNGNNPIKKPDTTSFLFSLVNEHNLPPTQFPVLYPNDAIYCDPLKGPIFGGTIPDLFIDDNSNISCNNCTNSRVYSSIQIPQKSSIFVNTNSSQETNYFKVDEIEVYGRYEEEF
ncbi:hypothetical protein WA158_001180 [Blastocystis sp. Blastoise]